MNGLMSLRVLGPVVVACMAPLNHQKSLHTPIIMPALPASPASPATAVRARRSPQTRVVLCLALQAGDIEDFIVDDEDEDAGAAEPTTGANG